MQWAQELYPLLGSTGIVCFFGDLASGKTTFIKGLSLAVGVHPDQVSSPTFSYMNIYEGRHRIYHFDLYRLKDEEEFLSLGLEEYLFSPGLKCLEWSERIEGILPQETVRIKMTHLGEEGRHILVEGV